MILWTRLFLEAQRYHVTDNVLHQDNESTIKLARNGRRSSSKQTRHIEVRYHFFTDHIERDRVQVSYCPTGDMLADYISRPLQGSLFRKFRHLILNINSTDELKVRSGEQECVGVNSEDNNATPSKQSVATVDIIPQGPTINLIDPYDQEAQRSYADVVRDNRSAHSIELIN